jgi:hypothetical protein
MPNKCSCSGCYHSQNGIPCRRKVQVTFTDPSEEQTGLCFPCFVWFAAEFMNLTSDLKLDPNYLCGYAPSKRTD